VMNRGTALLVVVIAMVGVAGIAAAGPVGTAVAQDDPGATNETSEGNGTATDISPGEQLSGVIGVQRAELAGEVESRAFEVALNRTESPEERADLVAEQLNRTEERLAEIERRQRELRERRDAGELTPGEFAARMAETSARAEAIKREANRSAEVAGELPESVRAERGLTGDRLGELRERAGDASGPEVAAIARGVAGNDVGGPLASDRRGPPGDAGDGPERGDGPGIGEGPGADGDTAADGPSERGNETDGNATNGADDATNEADDATNAVETPGDAGNDTTDRGADDGGDRGGENETPPRNGSSADGDERGNETDVGPNAAHLVGSTADRLVDPLTDGADIVRRFLGGIDG
jgi:hypothetical protein